MRIVNKVFGLVMTVFLFVFIGDVHAEEMASAALGASLSDEQQKETLEILGGSQLHSDKVLQIDGVKVDNYLHDGSDESTDVYSSAYIELKSEGYGVQVQILTPDNISQVSESMYQNAAITAGAKNVLIKIASVEPVTGEGALTGLYEVFEEEGFALDQKAIDTAEKQLTLEQKLTELTDLSADEISKLINDINLAVIDILSDDQVVDEARATDLVDKVLVDLNFNVSDEAHNLLVEHAQAYAKSPAAQDESTKLTIEQSTQKTILGKTFVSGNIEVNFDDVYLTSPREDKADECEHVLVLEYTLKNNHDEDYITGREFDVYVGDHKADNYYSSDNTKGSVAAGRTISVRVTYGFNGSTDNIELELKDNKRFKGEATIIPALNVRDEAEENNKDTADEVKSEEEEPEEETSVLLDNLDLIEKEEGNLLVPGEYKQDDLFGKMTLLKINEEEKKFMVTDELEVIVQAIKLFDLQGVDTSDMTVQMLGLDANGYLCQIIYSIINHADKEFKNTTIDRLIFSDGEQVDRNTFYDEPFELAPNAKVSNKTFVTRAPSATITGVELSIMHLKGEDSSEVPTQPMQVNFE